MIVTLGKDGAVAVGDGGAWWARPPEVTLISPVGSGDAFLALELHPGAIPSGAALVRYATEFAVLGE